MYGSLGHSPGASDGDQAALGAHHDVIRLLASGGLLFSPIRATGRAACSAGPPPRLAGLLSLGDLCVCVARGPPASRQDD
eukprot:12213760-Alexandrium_andersonii.AAC.1